MIYHGGCHCGAVQFQVEAPERITCLDCNCSICRKSGFLHLIVASSRFRLLRGEDELSTYTFNTGIARHRFCRICGIKSFYIPRSNPDGYDVNVRCLSPQPLEVVVKPFDGRKWEALRTGWRTSASIAERARALAAPATPGARPGAKGPGVDRRPGHMSYHAVRSPWPRIAGVWTA